MMGKAIVCVTSTGSGYTAAEKAMQQRSPDLLKTSAKTFAA